MGSCYADKMIAGAWAAAAGFDGGHEILSLKAEPGHLII